MTEPDLDRFVDRPEESASADVTLISRGVTLTAQVEETVKTILADVRREGDAAVRRYSETFDRFNPQSFRLGQEEIDAAVASLAPDELSAIRFSIGADAASRLRRSAKTRMLRSNELLRLVGCGGATVGVADTISR